MRLRMARALPQNGLVPGSQLRRTAFLPALVILPKTTI